MYNGKPVTLYGDPALHASSLSLKNITISHVFQSEGFLQRLPVNLT